MRVQAAPGLKVPREGQPRAYITEDQPVELATVTAYYIRRLAAGELIEAPAEAPQSGDEAQSAAHASATTSKKKA